jgi:hypothetical protein
VRGAYCSGLLLVASLAAVGCAAVRVEEKPVADVVLMVSRGADETVLTWNSRRGERYMILYADSRAAGARWRPLPGAESIYGTGATITLRDAVPGTRPRFYRIDVTPVSGRRP